MALVEILAGCILAIGFILFARMRGNFGGEIFLYSLGLIIAAVIYAGFGVLSGSAAWLLIEVAGIPVYALLAYLGMRRSAWFLSFGWAAHVLWDVILHDVTTAFVPFWYQMLCVGFDLTLAFYIGIRQFKSK